VAGDLVDWMRQLQNGTLPRQRFMERFGHLRPGTYDILSRRYDQMPDLAASKAVVRTEEIKPGFQLPPDKRKRIDALLEKEGFSGFDSDSLLDYVREAVVGREYGKLIFTRTVSDILELLANFGERHGLSREELSHVPLSCFLEIASASGECDVEERLRSVAHSEAERHMLSVAIRLPQILSDEAGVHVIPFQVSMPNFITHKDVSAPAVVLGHDGSTPRLRGKIVLIENADPGFDWIFSEEIAGLITKYGGANSHMAIRCAEFGIPAAIGCGEQRFEVLAKAGHIALDCSAGTINPFH
jgi:phosphohistidine swiveling domain-containing protein